VEVRQRLFLNLAQTSSEAADDWREVILIDERATPEQVRVLLDLFGERQGSHVTHPQDQVAHARAAYLVPMRYRIMQGQLMLSVTFSSDRSRLVHGTPAAPIQAWTFNGPVAVRGNLG
jgi:hypothetical protein